MASKHPCWPNRRGQTGRHGAKETARMSERATFGMLSRRLPLPARLLVSLSACLLVYSLAAAQEDPFAPINQAKRGNQETAAAVPKGKSTPIDDRIDFEITVKPKHARRGEVVQLTVTGTPRPGFHTYPLTQRTPNQEPSQLSTLTYGPAPGLQPLGP